MVPVPGLWVTLHRVGEDRAGPLDSVRSGRDGRFTFHYRHTGQAGAVYFVSASYEGIAYFSLPLQKRRVTGPDAEITVYDTTSRAVTLHVRGRHVVVSAPGPDGARDVVEVYEIANDTSVTLVSPDDAHPTWSAILPAEATQFQVGQGDISPASIRRDGGRIVSVAPFAPGLKQLSFAYRLPATAFPLSIPIEHGATVLEVLLEEPAAGASGPRLTAVAPVAVEGRRFRRFLAQDVPANAVIVITAPAAGASRRNARYLAGVAVAMALVMLGALALWAARERRAARAPVQPGPSASALPAVPDAAGLARAIAELDAEFERTPNPSDDERAAYRARRDLLKQRLAGALDAQRERA